MTKLIALFRRPEDPKEFDKHFNAVHIPLVKRYPGLRRLEITRITDTPIGEVKSDLMEELYFDNKDAMDSALASKEGKAVARDLLGFAAYVVAVFHGEVSGTQTQSAQQP